MRKGFAPIIIVIGLLLFLTFIAGAYFLRTQKNKQTLVINKNEFPKNCQLAINQKFMPSVIKDYNRDDSEKFHGDGTYLSYFYKPTLISDKEDVLQLSIVREASMFGNGDNKNLTSTNLRNQDLYKKVLSNEASDSEFKELADAYKNQGASVILTRETLSGIPLLLQIYQKGHNFEQPYAIVSFTNKTSGLSFSLSFAKERQNYQDYFNDWYRQSCV